MDNKNDLPKFIPKVINRAARDFITNHPVFFFLFIIFAIIFFLYFLPSFSAQTSRDFISLIVMSQITVFSLIFAISLFCSEFVSGMTSSFMVRFFFTDLELAKNWIIYFLCIAFEMLIFWHIPDNLDPNIFYPFQIWACDSIQHTCTPQLSFQINLNLLNFILIYLFIALFTVISICIFFKIMREFASFFTKDTILEKITAKIYLDESKNGELYFYDNFQMLFDTIYSSIKNSDLNFTQKTIKKIFREIIPRSSNCSENFISRFYDQISIVLRIARKENQNKIVLNVFCYIKENSDKLIQNEYYSQFYDLFFDNVIYYTNEEDFCMVYRFFYQMQDILKSLFDDSENKNRDKYNSYLSYCYQNKKIKEFKKLDDLFKTLNYGHINIKCNQVPY